MQKKKIMLDTNILISAVAFNSISISKLMEVITNKKKLTTILCSYVIDESYEVVSRKFPTKTNNLKKLLFGLRYESFDTPEVLPDHDFFTIRDMKDEKVLYSAILADVDILITGDKDFSDVNIERPEICTPFEFLEKYSDFI